jgi:hypothetical protein
MKKFLIVVICSVLAACGGGGYCEAGEPQFATAKDRAAWHAECTAIPEKK